MPPERSHRQAMQRPRKNPVVSSKGSPIGVLRLPGCRLGAGTLLVDCYRSGSSVLQKDDSVRWVKVPGEARMPSKVGIFRRSAGPAPSPHRHYELALERNLSHLTEQWPRSTTSFQQRRRYSGPKAITPPPSATSPTRSAS